ncbi:MAG: helix-turn-helix transcriptional regulator [Mycobacteriales bacterium]
MTSIGIDDSGAHGQLQQWRTRDRVRRLLLERGRASAAELGQALGLGPAAIRRHLDSLLAQGHVERRDRTVRGQRRRGRPSCDFALTAVGRAEFPHAYDELAVAALRQLAQVGGAQAVTRFAADQFAPVARRSQAAMAKAGSSPTARVRALAQVLTDSGYAAEVSTVAGGGQLCQHHCPVAAVAAAFPQLCEVETAAISRLTGTHVQRLATIAHGDGVCTTHIPATHAPSPQVLSEQDARPESTPYGRNAS